MTREAPTTIMTIEVPMMVKGTDLAAPSSPMKMKRKKSPMRRQMLPERESMRPNRKLAYEDARRLSPFAGTRSSRWYMPTSLLGIMSSGLLVHLGDGAVSASLDPSVMAWSASPMA